MKRSVQSSKSCPPGIEESHFFPLPLLDISALFLGSDISFSHFPPTAFSLLPPCLHPLPLSRLSFFLPPLLFLSPCSCSPKCEVMIVAMATKTSSQSGFVLIRPFLPLSPSLFLATLPCQHGLHVMIINEIIAILHLIITAVIYRTWRYHHHSPSDITTDAGAAAAAATAWDNGVRSIHAGFR